MAPPFQVSRGKIATGIEFIDSLLHGGQISNGVHGLLGPTGGGKTALGIMIAVNGALEQHRTNPPGGAWAFVTLDEPALQLWPRAFSYGGRISRECFEGESPSTTENPKEYEIRRQSELRLSNGMFVGECERYVEIRQVFQKHLHIVDMHNNVASWERKNPVVSIRDAVLRQTGSRLAGVVIDYAGIAVRRMLERWKLPHKDESFHLSNFSALCRNIFCAEFGCPAWVIHQLNGAANGRTPGAFVSEEDAANCKSFADHLDVCFSLGLKDMKSRCFLFRCNKSPVEPPTTEPTILCFDPDFAAIRRNEKYMFSPTMRRIESPVPRVKIKAATLDKLRRMVESGKNKGE